MTGRFIVFDGQDRSELDRQSAALAAWLREQGLIVATTHEPSDGPVGGQVRQVLAGRVSVASLPVPLLFLADRLDHLHKEPDGILAQLREGKWVVCSRYLLSALAYQSDLASPDWLARINRPCPWPDLMVWCDGPGDGVLRDRFAFAVDYYRREGRRVTTIAEDQAVVRDACRTMLAPAQGAGL